VREIISIVRFPPFSLSCPQLCSTSLQSFRQPGMGSGQSESKEEEREDVRVEEDSFPDRRENRWGVVVRRGQLRKE